MKLSLILLAAGLVFTTAAKAQTMPASKQKTTKMKNSSDSMRTPMKDQSGMNSPANMKRRAKGKKPIRYGRDTVDQRMTYPPVPPKK